MSGSAKSLPIPAGNTANRPVWIWFVVVIGYFLPGLIGISTWLYLRSVGKPVMSIDWIVSAIPVLCFFSVIWVLPFLLVALTAAHADLHQKKIKGMIYGAFLGTGLSEVVVFGAAWNDSEAVVMGVLFLPVAVFVGTIASGGIGYLCGRALEAECARSGGKTGAEKCTFLTFRQPKNSQ